MRILILVSVVYLVLCSNLAHGENHIRNVGVIFNLELFYVMGVTQNRDFVEIDFVESPPQSLLDI